MQVNIAKHVGIPYTLLADDEIFDLKDTPWIIEVYTVMDE